jgi:predicted unusual protein kinase regulating ubiquinone biosynthesis (AarF/ABC1/UbiB family)
MLLYFRDQLKGDSRFVLPEPIPEFCGKRVLAMSFEPGATVDSEEVAALSQERRNTLSRNIFELYFRELFEFRKMQTDPHFGNYRIRVDAKGTNDQIILYDYGAIREFSPDFIKKYSAMLSGLFYADRKAFEKGAAAMGLLALDDPQELKDLFYELCAAIVEPVAEEDEYDWKANDLPKRVSRLTWEIIRRFPLRAPPRELVFLDRKMIGMYTFLAVLRARISARPILAPYMKR